MCSECKAVCAAIGTPITPVGGPEEAATPLGVILLLQYPDEWLSTELAGDGDGEIGLEPTFWPNILVRATYKHKYLRDRNAYLEKMLLNSFETWSMLVCE